MPLNVFHEFVAPGAAYRGKPFWAWNGKLEPEELRRQIRLMHQMGLGGFFMHSRVGLDTAYLSSDWFKCIDACIDEAERLGMEAWLYDEDRWPSGAAGGLVTKNPKHRMRSLMLDILMSPEEFAWSKDTLAVFTAYLDGDQAHQVVKVATGKQPPALLPGQVILQFKIIVQEPSPWYNGHTYLDTLSHDAVREYIKSTHSVYLQKTGKYFARTIPGIFTDEPNHGHNLEHDNNTGTPRGVPWTPALLKTFKKRYGYDLLPRLVELFYDVDAQPVSEARYHFHECLAFLFVDAFSRQIGEWCDNHKLQFTGHVLEEDSLSRQTNVVSNAMRFYEYMQAPGMDLLTEHWRSFNTAKQVTSVARQFGRKWRLTETYGCTGWDFPFAGHKALGDWQVALGINLRCQHLAWYTMRGEAKRDYPASIFYQSPWWSFYPKVEDYFARVMAVMTQGSEVRDLLVIHPIESMWLKVKSGWMQNPDTLAYDTMLTEMCESLLAGHVDFDYGDEEMLTRHGRVRKTDEHAELVVGKATYRAILVPPLITMRASTLQMLKRFNKAGGTVIFAGDAPQYLNATSSHAPRLFSESCLHGVAVKGAELVHAVEASCRRIAITDAADEEIAAALYLLREDEEAYYLFVCNTSEDFAHTPDNYMGQPLVRERTLSYPAVTIRGFADAVGLPLQLDPENGAIYRARAIRDDDGWQIYTDLPALASRLFIIPKTEQVIAETMALPLTTEVRTEILPADGWTVQLTEANNLVLDRPRYRIADHPWEDATEVLRVDRAVRQALGVPARSGSMVQPWARKKIRKPKTVNLVLSYSFDVTEVPSGDLFLAIESPSSFVISLNGVVAKNEATTGWWTDRSLEKVPLDPSVLRRGKNELVLECAYPENHAGLEIIYLLGNFGVTVLDRDVTLTTPPATLTIGDWCEQGLAFYSGSVIYRREIHLELRENERLFVEVPDYRGVAIRVLVDGKPAGIIAWEPNEIEITDLIGNTPVMLQVEVIGHRRNSHGPFHHHEKWPAWTGPGEFQDTGDRWFDGYQLVPCGLMAEPRLSVRKLS